MQLKMPVLKRYKKEVINGKYYDEQCAHKKNFFFMQINGIVVIRTIIFQ